MTKLTYSEQLKHPNWQRKRLEVMTRDDFTCQLCKDKDTQLHVHHKRYIKGREVWDYELDDLVTLCWPCHESMHEQLQALMSIVGRLAVDGPYSLGEAIGILAGWANNYCGYDLSEFECGYGTLNYALGSCLSMLDNLPHELLFEFRSALVRVNNWDREDGVRACVDHLNKVSPPTIGMDGARGVDG